MMQHIRQMFPVTQTSAFLDVANKCAPPSIVVDALCEFFRRQAADGGDKQAWFDAVDEVKAKFAALINARPGEIAVLKNTSEGFNLIANSLSFRPGENIVITEPEHPNNVFPWLRQKARGVDVRVVESNSGTVTAADIARHVDSGTRLVSVASVACVTGARLDIGAIARVCHSAGAYLMVDAVQSCGIMEVDVARDEVDFLAAGAYKGMLSPHGLAFLYCSSRVLGELVPPFAARASVKVATGLHKVKVFDVDYRDDAGRFEVGNYNYSAARAGSVALDFIMSLGVPHIMEHVLDLTGRFIEGVKSIGLSTLGPQKRSERSGIVSVSVKDAHRVVAQLREQGVIATEREGSVRFSFHVYNNDDDIERALTGLKRFAL